MQGMQFCRRARRMLIAIAAIVALLAVQPSVGWAAPARLEKELVIVDTGGVFQRLLKEHFYDPFSTATGVTVRAVAASSAEQWTKLKAMAQAGRVEWDIVSVDHEDLNPHKAWLEDLGDCKAIPTVAAQGVPGTCERYAVLRTIGGGVIAYNTQKLPAGRRPRDWTDFWDVQKFPGPRALPNAGFPWWNLMAALMADGVPPDKLFPLDLDRAFRKLNQLKPHVRVWWKTGDQSQQAMRSGEVAMAMMWSGRALGLKASGVPIEVEWNQAIRDVAYWGVARGAPHPKAALAFLDFFMGRPEAHLAFSRAMFYDTSNQKAVELVPEAERPTRPTFPANWSRITPIDLDWVAANQDRILERWNAWVAR